MAEQRLRSHEMDVALGALIKQMSVFMVRQEGLEPPRQRH